MKKWNLRLGISLLLLGITLSCVLLAPEEPTMTPADTEPDTEPGTDVTVTLTATSPPTETATPETDDTGSADEPPTETPEDCTLDADFVEDVTIPDDTVLEPGAGFRKTWRLRNSGTCNWEPGTQLIFVGGEALSEPDGVVAPAAAVGSSVDVSVELTAPSAPGTYRSEWRLQAPDGTRFGPTIYVQILVPKDETATPTLTETPVPVTVTPTPEETACDIAYDPAFVATVDYASVLGFEIGCPQGSAYETYGAAQIFWANVDAVNPHQHYRTLMIWNRPYKQGEIYYVTVSETSPVQPFHAAYDTWEEDMPETPPACAGMTVPDGYIMPIRGFGKLWCEQSLWDTIGWPREPETGLNFLVQPTEGGRLMRFGDPLLNTYAVAWDYDSNEALVQMNPPAP